MSRFFNQFEINENCPQISYFYTIINEENTFFTSECAPNSATNFNLLSHDRAVIWTAKTINSSRTLNIPNKIKYLCSIEQFIKNRFVTCIPFIFIRWNLF